MWTYRQSTGELSREGAAVARGYSGCGECKNDPGKQDVLMHGPIPRGHYSIGEPYDTQTHGPFVMRLTPAPTNEMHSRSGFLIHGDSVRAPGTASEGCIILQRSIRVAINASGDREIEVVA